VASGLAPALVRDHDHYRYGSGQSATASLTVAEPTLVSITVPPATVTVYQGTAIQLTATGEYADGTSVDLTNSVTWSSSNTSAAR